MVALRIAHLAFSSTGGAGSVASRLAEAQRREGHDAFVVSAISGSLRDAPLGKPLHTAAAVLDDKALRSTSFAAPISLLRDRLHTTLEVIDSADVIHLHWPNGFVDLGGLAKAAGDKKVVWTLHDMNAFTAVCHYALSCRGFESGCERCPALKTPFSHLAGTHWNHKRAQLEAFQDLSFVAPSSWLAGEAESSAMLQGIKVAVIRNPLPSPLPTPTAMTKARAQLGLGRTDTVFVVSAAHLGDPLKAVDEAVRVFSSVVHRDAAATLLLLGRGSPDISHPRVRHLGFVDREMSELVLSAADYLVVPSLAENQPLAIAEAQAFGVSLIARNTSGLPEHLEIDPEGALFSNGEELGDIFHQLLARPRSAPTRASLAKRARKRFDPQAVVNAYDRVYRGL